MDRSPTGCTAVNRFIHPGGVGKEQFFSQFFDCFLKYGPCDRIDVPFLSIFVAVAVAMFVSFAGIAAGQPSRQSAKKLLLSSLIFIFLVKTMATTYG